MRGGIRARKEVRGLQPVFPYGDATAGREADLIIVNHHLFFADLALKQDDFGSILPEYSAVVFDEAHEMETWPAIISGDRFRITGLRNWRGMPIRRCACCTWARLPCCENTGIRERSRGFFELFPRATDGFRSHATSARRSSSKPRGLRFPGDALKSMETEFAALTTKPEELTRHRAAEFRI